MPLLFQNTLAKALYDNKAECLDELAFRRGDILMVLEQNLLGSEGWWKCSLHGKQGLAPANRLQLLTPSVASSAQHDAEGLPVSQTIYQVPSAHRSSASLSVYEHMDGWITPSPPPSSSFSHPLTQELYQVPALAAQVLSEKTQSSSNQVKMQKKNLSSKGKGIPPEAPHYSNNNMGLLGVFQVVWPCSRNILEHGHSARTTYNNLVIPAMKTFDNIIIICIFLSTAFQVYVIPTGVSKDIVMGNHLAHYNTLPNLRKSEWVYDIPVSPEKSKQASQNHSPNRHALYDIPPARSDSRMQKIPSVNSEGKLVNAEAYDIPPIQNKLAFPVSLLYDVPSTHDALVQHQNGIPSGALSTKTEKENHQQTVYDIPKGMPVALTQKRENAYSSRASTISTLSSSSTESFSSTASSSTLSSSSEESTKKSTMQLELAIGTLTKLQHSVSSSVASLMIFVSSKWRYHEHLEENIEEIHRAIDHIKVSLGEFLNFARTIEENGASGCDSKLQARIKEQLNNLTDSFQILVETRDALNDCKWSLDLLVIKKPQSNPDDLDRFVMVARTIPDDIKRFVAIIIANGKLLFRKNCKDKDGKDQKTGGKQKLLRHTLECQVEDESVQKSIFDKPKENKLCSEKQRADGIEDCDYSRIQVSETGIAAGTSKWFEVKGNIFSKISSGGKKIWHVEAVRQIEHLEHFQPWSTFKQGPATKMELSNICRLYFGAVQKAISVFHQSLSRDQAPEVFIAKSKLIIMVGQKLVDTLCQEAIEKTNRNEILCGSSQFCALLKSLAVATKNAAMQYPSPEAMRELQDQVDGLSKYTQHVGACCLAAAV
uniref:Cas scaffold protein family member 4 n=1 Tax=Anolis carolinensis TaxID=28377 RepID=A0A803SYW4_ANOCA